MRNIIKPRLARLGKDIWQIKLPLIVLIIYGVITQLAFGTVCLFRIVFGINCPGCGLTRGSLCVLTGQWSRVIDYNPMAFAWIIVMGWLILERYILMKDKVRWELPVIVAGIATLAYYVFGLIR